MGNLASSSTPDDTGADKLEALSFFRTLDIDIVRSIVKEWKSVAKELVPWKLYFTTMVKYEEELKYGKEVFVRKYWNPACMNYAMRKEAINLNDDRTEEVANTSINVSEGHTTNQNDAFTDDYSSNEGSGIAENEKSNDVNEEFSNVPVVSSLSATIHPSFIGYQTVTIKQYEQIKQREGIERKKREQRAMEKAISVRTNMINKQEEQFRSQKQSRENKIQQLKKSYESEKVKRKGEYDKEIIGLQDSLAATLKVCFFYCAY